MKGKALNGETIVDWVDHEKLFRELLKFQDTARLLTIHNKNPGTGKSTVLMRLKWVCENIPERVPVSLVPLEDKKVKGTFEMVNHLRDDLVNFQLNFPRFDALNLARTKFDTTPFTPASGPIVGSVNMSNATASGGVQAGVYNEIGHQIVNSGPPPTAWANPNFERIAREACVRAFFEDLKTIWQENAMVLLFDSWDADPDSAELRKWIRFNVLYPHCFNVVERPARLVIVIAGREDLGLVASLESRYPELVRSNPFKTWDEQDIKQFVELHGYKDSLTDDDWTWLFKKFKDETFTVGKALQFLNLAALNSD